MKKQITNIFFDLFGVLLGIDQSVVVQYLAKLTETPYLETREIAMGEAFMRLERDEINFDQYVDKISSELPNGNRIETNVLRDMWMNSRVGEMPSVSLLDKLQDQYKVWIISNTSESHIQNLKSKFTFLNHVDGIITSELAGAHKPNPEIFRFALNEAKVDMGSTIFIDDSHVNVKSAESMGIISHHYTDFEKFDSFCKDYLKI